MNSELSLTKMTVTSAAQDRRRINVVECVVPDVLVGSGIAATAAGIEAATNMICVVKRVDSVNIALRPRDAVVSPVTLNAFVAPGGSDVFLDND